MVGRRPGTALTLLVAGLLLAAGCGGGDSRGGDQRSERGPLPECPLEALGSAPGPVEVVVWHSQRAETRRTLEALADRYNSSQAQVRVRLEHQGAGYQELIGKFTQAIPRRQLPAAVVVDDTATRYMADSGVVLPAQSCIDAGGDDLSRFRPAAVDHFTVDGALYPASVNLGGALTYYNRNHFRRAGLDPEDPPQTLAELRAAAEAIKAADVAPTPMVLSLTSWVFEYWLTGAGASLVDNDNGRGEGGATTSALADDDTALELLTWIQQMQADGLLLAIPFAEGQINQYLALAAQEASFTVESSAAATSIAAFLEGDLDLGEVGPGPEAPADTSGLDIAAGPFAGLDAGGRGQMSGAAWYVVGTTPPEVQAATWDFMRFLNSVDAQVELNLEGSALPFVQGALDDPRLRDEWTTTEPGRWLALADQMLVEGVDPAFPGPLIGPYTEVRIAVRHGLEALTVGDRTPVEALQLMEDEIDAALDRYRSDGS